MITWEELIEVEPELKYLYKEALTLRDCGGERFCSNILWYRLFKPRLSRLVGVASKSPDERLHTSKAYDVAYRKIHTALPPCRNCGL